MKIYKDFVSYNKSIGLAAPLDNDIDVGCYDPPRIIVANDPVVVDFYRISIKIKCKRKSTPDIEPVSAIFFNTPDLIIEPGWDAEPTYTECICGFLKKSLKKTGFCSKHIWITDSMKHCI